MRHSTSVRTRIRKLLLQILEENQESRIRQLSQEASAGGMVSSATEQHLRVSAQRSSPDYVPHNCSLVQSIRTPDGFPY